MVILLTVLVFFAPNLLGDAENFKQANPLVTPVHIRPEWYFLFAYAILRSIPNKLGGVLALFASILILFLLPGWYRPMLRVYEDAGHLRGASGSASNGRPAGSRKRSRRRN